MAKNPREQAHQSSSTPGPSLPIPLTSHFDPTRLVLIIASALVVIFVGLPIGMLTFGSVWSVPPGLPGGSLTLGNYLAFFSAIDLSRLLVNSVVIAIGTGVISTSLAVAMAWLLVRTNIPGKRIFEVLVIFPYFVPAALQANSWILLYSPKTGLVNDVIQHFTGAASGPLNVYSMTGIILIGGLYGVTLPYLLIASALRSVNPSLEEAAKMNGSGGFSMLRRVTLPLVSPAILSSLILMVIIGLGSFQVPYLLGTPADIDVFVTSIFREVYWYPPNYGAAMALSTLMLAVAIVGIGLYRWIVRKGDSFAQVTGKDFRPRVLDLGAWRRPAGILVALYFGVILVLPMAVLGFFSLLPYQGNILRMSHITLSFRGYLGIFHDRAFLIALEHSILYSGTAAIAVIGLSILAVYAITRYGGKRAMLLESLTLLPIGVPSLVLAVGLLWTFAVIKVGIFDTQWILIFAYMLVGFPIATRFLSPAMLQIHKDLEEAALVTGASRLTTIRRVVLPLIRPAVFSVWLLLFFAQAQESTMSTLLISPGNSVLGTVVGDGGGTATSFVLVAIFGGLLLLSLALTGKRFTSTLSNVSFEITKKPE